MNTKIAEEFLTRCFRPDETIALLLRRENPLATTQRVVRLEQVLAPRHLAWLRHENVNGANVYVAVNPLRPGSRKRTKDSIAEVRHLYLDIDVDGENRLAALRASEVIPSPSTIISTSRDKYQVFWRVEGYDFDQQESTLKLLAVAFGGDPACTDRNRVLRIPGFENRKYDPAYAVTVEYPNDSVWQPGDFRLGQFAGIAIPLGGQTSLQSSGGQHTDSEADWAWTLRQLTLGNDAIALTLELANRRPDKPNPLYYAQRTVDLASARIALLDGTAIESVIALLVRRRSDEIPELICVSRAREIATTAQRMIARHKFASIHQPKENHNATA
ncbi:RepB family DNA primase [Tunturiibacter gelidiferens]|uniref:RepB family DNA primase n=1 Tax=Tunturiibacter gelidiferens TaxID=3069689 RepID=A0AAU7YWB0_9BACT